MHERALIRRIVLSSVEAGMLDAVSPGSAPLALAFADDTSLDFTFRGAYRGLNVLGA